MPDPPIRTLDRWWNAAAARGIRPDLGPIRAALQQLGLRPPPSILVGGTNGKGSTTTFATALLRAAGLRVGTAISPHLQHLRERVRLDGRPVDEGHLERVAAGLLADDRARDALLTLSPFEIGILLAHQVFADEHVDVGVFEVGLGGEWDASRTCEPRVSVLTTIAADHLEWLGPTLRDVARTKARIAEPRCPLIVGPVLADLLEVVQHEAQAVGATLLRWDERWVSGVPPQLGLAGPHQRTNAALALVAARALLADLGRPLPDSTTVAETLAGVMFPARLETIPSEDGRHWLLDGAHNPEGARALVAALDERHRRGESGPHCLVFAAMADKDYGAVLESLLCVGVRHLVLTQGTTTPRYAPATSLHRLCQQIAPAAAVHQRATVPEALDLARTLTPPGAEILVAGSLYFAGEVRDAFGLAPA